jgi:hypothetical protein
LDGGAQRVKHVEELTLAGCACVCSSA